MSAEYRGPRHNSVKTYIEDELKEDIEALAQEMGMTVSQAIRWLSIQGIKSNRPKVAAVA